jgi:hypothetical protein
MYWYTVMHGQQNTKCKEMLRFMVTIITSMAEISTLITDKLINLQGF